MVSAQVVLVSVLKLPPLVESFVTYSRSLTFCTTAPASRPLTVKRRNACLALPLPPTWV